MTEMMINIKFPDSSNPRGIRLISIPSSSFTAYVIPRKLIKDVQQIDGIDNPGIYFLMTQRADGFYIYAGQARNGINRLNNHNVSKEFWDNAIMFLGSNDVFTLDVISGLEKLAIEHLNDNNSCHLENRVVPAFQIPENIRNIISELYSQISFVLSYVTGKELLYAHTSYVPESVNVQENKNAENEKAIDSSEQKTGSIISKPDPADYEYVINTPERNGYMKIDLSSYVVIAGSVVNMESPIASDFMNKKRNAQMKRGNIVNREGKFYLIRDMEFSSPGEAASFVLGGKQNGQNSWINNITGISLYEERHGKIRRAITSLPQNDDIYLQDPSVTGIQEFIKDHEIGNTLTEDTFNSYISFARERGFDEVTKTKFSQVLKQLLPVTVKKVWYKNRTVSKYVVLGPIQAKIINEVSAFEDTYNIKNAFTKDAYKDYLAFAKQNNYEQISLSMFTRAIKQIAPVAVKKVRVKNKILDMYVAVDQLENVSQ